MICYLIIFSQCASYTKHRASDIQDILTLGIEKESYGLGFRVSILPIGFFFQSKQELTKGYGLRGGEFGSYSTKQLLFGFGGGESFYHGEVLKDTNGKPFKSDGMFLVSDKRSNLKSHDLKYLQVLKSSPSQRRKRQREKDLRSLVEELSEKSDSSELLEQLPKEKLKPHGYASHYPYQVEIFLGLYYGLRFGFNFAEAFDAIFGFFKIDILEDDIQGEIKLEEL